MEILNQSLLLLAPIYCRPVYLEVVHEDVLRQVDEEMNKFIERYLLQTVIGPVELEFLRFQLFNFFVIQSFHHYAHFVQQFCQRLVSELEFKLDVEAKRVSEERQCHQDLREVNAVVDLVGDELLDEGHPVVICCQPSHHVGDEGFLES